MSRRGAVCSLRRAAAPASAVGSVAARVWVDRAGRSRDLGARRRPPAARAPRPAGPAIAGPARRPRVGGGIRGDAGPGSALEGLCLTGAGFDQAGGGWRVLPPATACQGPGSRWKQGHAPPVPAPGMTPGGAGRRHASHAPPLGRSRGARASFAGAPRAARHAPGGRRPAPQGDDRGVPVALAWAGRLRPWQWRGVEGLPARGPAPPGERNGASFGALQV